VLAFADTVDGEEIVTSLARPLETKHGGGVSATNLGYLRRFGEVFEAEKTVYALSRQLS
jgi:hypothetical protein